VHQVKKVQIPYWQSLSWGKIAARLARHTGDIESYLYQSETPKYHFHPEINNAYNIYNNNYIFNIKCMYSRNIFM
jgi:hypothetical protein